MTGSLLWGVLSLIRILTLSIERISIHQLGRKSLGSLPTMCIGFGGASILLWIMTLCFSNPQWILSTVWSGMIYALAFGMYTAALTKGPLSIVSPWSNITVILLWLFHPTNDLVSWIGFILFSLGVLLMIQMHMNRAILFMIGGSICLAIARVIDVQHLGISPLDYGASQFTVISFWMMIPLLLQKKFMHTIRVIRIEPQWSFIAASSNAAAYLTLFLLLHWLHPATVEAISTLASGTALVAGVYFFQEKPKPKEILSSILMILGTLILLWNE